MDKKELLRRRGQEAGLAAWVVIGAAAAFLAYFAYFTYQGDVPGDSASWAEFGAYFEGVVSPVVGIVTVILVVRTLHATRDESEMTRKEMQAQLEHLRRTQVLAELQKRLDGALAAWNSLMALNRANIRVDLLDEGGPTRETVGEVLNHPDTLRLIAALKAGHTNWRRKSNLWGAYLNEEVNLLIELGGYCADYDEAAGDSVLTEFYRRRVNLAMRAFEAAEVLPPVTVEQLTVGRYSFVR